MEKKFHFELIHKSKKSSARVGRIFTPHGVIDTPAFVGVGTNGTMKTLDNILVDDLGLQLMFCNTYHLIIQPGTKLIKEAGGLHKFINRTQPIITDSGGFQVFSLAYPGSWFAHELKRSNISKKENSLVVKVNEDGVIFRSYRDGSIFLLSPESSIQAQKDLGSDIIIPLDELIPFHISPKKMKESFERTHRWEQRSLEEHLKNPQNQAIYGVVHGGTSEELRKKSCDFLNNLPFDGFAIGGTLGETKQDLFEVLSYTNKCLPEEHPRHLLGIGDLESIDKCILLGIDTFDSSYPTKAARHGLLFTKKGPIKIRKANLATASHPIEEGCTCSTCQRFSLGYLHHLFRAKEPTGLALASIHNLHFMLKQMQEYREAILNDQI